ncbi:hypothetical protein BN1012_Phect2832 [Candidatus Phaeomarinobacter ectocarpi]|uniref:Uncharacterized protein n=1 Tax=Candidatus Phaeomarinibacter ectocarpi TaxID=1458461 RepID=X5MN72_9HYPH|nr:autotransporter outer membrane beta-barrel domain-containing protein [Candidatus Phaeomarinobacter ectocarpi]CDO61045.1 hypothetical protein BN1012_Phect2832 [Candidatus Phaeomarinobacter ectocarpi]
MRNAVSSAAILVSLIAFTAQAASEEPFQIPGTYIQSTNAETARRISWIIADLDSAIAACDRGAYDQALAKADELKVLLADAYENVREPLRRSYLRSNDPFWKDLRPLDESEAAAEREVSVPDYGDVRSRSSDPQGDIALDISIIDQVVETRPFPQTCETPPRPSLAIVDVGVTLGRVSYKVGGLLGTETLAGARTLNVVKPDEDGTVYGASGSAAYMFALSEFLNAFVAGGYFGSSASIESTLPDFDPAGDRLLIVGTGDPNSANRSGFSLNSFGGLNRVTNVMSSSHLEWDGAWVKGGLDMPCECLGLTVRPFAGVAFTRSRLEQYQSGNIPGFGRTFRYDTHVKTNTVSPLFGVDLSKSIHPMIALNLSALGSVDVIDAKGSDTLNFTGFNPQSVSLSENDTSFGWRLGTGVTLTEPNTNMSLSFSATYQHSKTAAVTERTGLMPTHIRFDDAKFLTGSANLRLTF